jgi:oligoribonuclease (3'-5' exoribonuclease)
LKQKIQHLKELIEIQSIIVDASISIVKELAAELKEQDELEKRMDDFDNSIKKTKQGYSHTSYNKKKPTTYSKENDVYIETRWV